MILREELTKIGIVTKPHGLKGEMVFTYTNPVFDREDEEIFLIFNMNGIFVPFLLEEYRIQTDERALIKLKGVDDDREAKRLMKHEVYFLLEEMDEIDHQQGSRAMDYFIGYSVIDALNVLVGDIVEVDDSTENILFVVKRSNGEEVFIPATDDYVMHVDEEGQVIRMEIPDGLLDL